MEERTINITVAEYNELISDKLIRTAENSIFSKDYKGCSGGISAIEDVYFRLQAYIS